MHHFALVRFRLISLITIACLANPVASGAQIYGTGTGTQTTSPAVSMQPEAMPPSDNPFLGSVRTGRATDAILPLSLSDALERALAHNLGLALGTQDSRAARAERLHRLSALLPDVSGTVSGTRQTLNLAALGFNFTIPGFTVPTVVGPFGLADARVSISQPILNWSDLTRWRAAKESERAAALGVKNDREIVVLAAGYAYLKVLADHASLDAIRAQVTTAQTLADRAVDQNKSGVIAGIDVLRARVALQQQQQRRIAAEATLAIDKLALARVIGLPPGQAFEASDEVPYAPLEMMTVEDAVARARAARPDYLQARSQLRAAELTHRSMVAANYPSLWADANAGTIGSPNFGDARRTYSVAISLQIPIFNGTRLLADTLRADADVARQRAIVSDLEARIDDQVRTAFLTLRASADLVQVARSNVTLADETLTQAQHRFVAGVADNLEVVQAQESVATAHTAAIESLHSYNLAKLTLAQALGVAEASALTYLGAK
jgi:outer membrane protein TolC